MRKLLTTLLFTMALAFSGMANAIPIGTVGPNYDTLVVDDDNGTTLANSGFATEEAWVQSILGNDFTYTELTDAESQGSAWEAVTNANGDIMDGDYALDLSKYNPEYFLVKVGAGTNDPVYTHFLFNNADSVGWAYLNLSTSFGDVDNAVVIANIGKVSHVGVSDGPTSVPEPSISALLGLGLLGMIGVSRRKTVT